MTLGDKLRFLADRAEDGKPFFMDGVYALDGNVLKIGDAVTIEFNKMKSTDLKIKPAWEFTEDEKAILRNTDDRWRWITRDENRCLHLYNQKPYKRNNIWMLSTGNFTSLHCFRHLFKSVQWEDDEPCEFKKYI